ncbi:hypothetical protein [Cyanobium sp. Morenito 9A2]|uniref:hypothetical protein n=1 Tax=Cyanobium sp. Morenito 9A2 TaxID=2823718 RepID=UPI0020CC3DC7|nr:hypothetical protein [Cyanobium sp. Morenito 9A2]MCP9850167.1 hypothetical protein [Cyanobium sp. Morenito 9A2]
MTLQRARINSKALWKLKAWERQLLLDLARLHNDLRLGLEAIGSGLDPESPSASVNESPMDLVRAGQLVRRLRAVRVLARTLERGWKRLDRLLRSRPKLRRRFLSQTGGPARKLLKGLRRGFAPGDRLGALGRDLPLRWKAKDLLAGPRGRELELDLYLAEASPQHLFVFADVWALAAVAAPVQSPSALTTLETLQVAVVDRARLLQRLCALLLLFLLERQGEAFWVGGLVSVEEIAAPPPPDPLRPTLLRPQGHPPL